MLALLALPGRTAVAQPAPGSALDSAVVDTTRTGAVTPAPRVSATPSDEAAQIAGMGFDNVTVDPARHAIAYENRRFRHSAYARGVLDRGLIGTSGSPTDAHLYFERRFGLTVAAIETPAASGGAGAQDGAVPTAVRYPSDAGFPAPPGGRPLGPTRWATDFDLAPHLTYEVGALDDPFRARFELEPRVRTNPWPGARLTGSLLIPIVNEFVPDSFSPDLDRVRPGTVTVEQFAWLPRVALVSGTAGIFFDNRYGASLGVARPLQGGTFLLDAQADVTGFIAFPSGGAEYSSVRHLSGFGGLAWRPPVIDCAVRVRGVRFIDGDQGGEFEVRRAFGDMDIAFFYQRTSGLNASGIRVLFPMAPAVRRHAVTHPPGLPLRVFPVDRIGLDYTDQAGSVGRNLRGVASREDLLRQLNLPGLTANAYRYRAARAWDAQTPPAAEPDRVSLTGMTGFINTPWCGVITERMLEVGYNQIPRGAAYDHRGIHRNDVYYAALGFLPHFEAGVRWTAIPGLHAFTQDIPTSQVTDTDRMLSGRIEILTPKPGRPGLSLGAEDIAGTRRFHSTYIVTGMPFVYRRLAARVSLGYAPRVFSTVDHRTLDGGFGAAEASVWRPLAVAVEYDTEKWNAGLAISGPLGFKARATLLKGGFVSLGGGWSVRL